MNSKPSQRPLTELEMYALKCAIEGKHDQWQPLSFNGVIRYQLENMAASKVTGIRAVELLSFLYDAETLKAMNQLDTSAAPPAPQIEKSWQRISVHDLHKLRKVGWLIPGLLPEEGLTMVYGPSGVGKSFFVLHLAMLLSRKFPVAYVATEGQSGYYARTAAWEKFHRANAGQLEFFMGIVTLLEKDQLDLFIAEIAQVKPRLIVIDTMGITMLPGDENSTRDMQQFIRAAQRLTDRLQTAVLLVHHTNKQGEQERGNAALRAACDMMVKLSQDDDVILVECAKSKDFKPFDPLRLKQVEVEVQTDDATLGSIVLVDAGAVVQTATDPLTKHQRKVLETLHELDDGMGMNPGQVEAVTGLGSGQVTKAMKRLMQFGFVLQDEPRQPYRISSDGKRKLDNKDTTLSLSKTLQVSTLKALFEVSTRTVTG